MTDGDKIAAHLRTIRRAWPDMLPTGPRTGQRERVHSTREPSPPAPIAVLSLRREVCEVLASWVRLVLEDALDVNGGTMVVHLDGRDAEALAGWLVVWADWLGEHEAARIALDELGMMARLCEDVVTQRRVRRFRVGPCIDFMHDRNGEPILNDGRLVSCTGKLFALIRSEDDLLPSVLTCTADPAHAYTASEWRRLGERIYQVTVEVELMLA